MARDSEAHPPRARLFVALELPAAVRQPLSAWADDKIGLKPKGRTPEAKAVNGKTDFYQAPVIGKLDPSSQRR